MNARFPVSLSVVAVVLCFAVHSAVAQQAEITPRELDEMVQPYVDGNIVNAVSVVVVQDDNSFTRHYGQLSKKESRKPDDSTIYEIGSISKVFTGILLAHAVETGQLELDQPIGSIMRELQSQNKDVGDSILLRHLATHASGLPRLPDNMAPANPANPYAEYDRAAMTSFMSKVRPEKKPGEEASYSNLGAGLLGELLSANADMSYEELLVSIIARPLEMTDTVLRLSEAQQSRLAPPHNADLQVDHVWDFDTFAGAGGIRSTIDDMRRFVQANLDPPGGPLGDAINLAWKQHLPARGDAFAMGLGWHIARDGETRWHNGQTGGYHSMMLVNRRLKTAVVALSNTATGEVDALAESIIQKMAGMDVKPRTFPKTKPVSAELVKRLEGRYQIVPGFILSVRAEGEKLFVQATAQPEFHVYPDSDTKWRYRVVDAQLTFELPDDEGGATAVTLHQGGRDMRAPRLDADAAAKP